MKTSNVLASMLFGSLAAAAPMKRALVTVTSTVVQTEITYTTVYAGESVSAVAAPTSSAAAFFEKSSIKASVPVAASTTIKTSAVPAPTTSKSSAVSAPSTVKTSAAPTTAPVVVPTSTKVPTTTAAPAKPTTTAVAAKPTTTAAAAPTTTAAASPTTSAAASPTTSAAAAPTATASTGSGSVHSGGSMTLNYFSGNLGSCGQPIADTDMTVALAADLYGASTYDVATGNPTNKWCKQKVAITYNGKTTTATIMDKCPGCTNGGFDMTPKVWEAVTGSSTGDRITGMTWQTI